MFYVPSAQLEQSENLFHVEKLKPSRGLKVLYKMASLFRNRIIPRLARVTLVSRPLATRSMMVLVKKEEEASVVAERIKDILTVFTEQQNEMNELQKEVAELEQENARLRALVGEDEEDDEYNEVSDSKIDRDSIEEKLAELEEKLDDAKGLVDDIRELLQ